MSLGSGNLHWWHKVPQVIQRPVIQRSYPETFSLVPDPKRSTSSCWNYLSFKSMCSSLTVFMRLPFSLYLWNYKSTRTWLIMMLSILWVYFINEEFINWISGSRHWYSPGLDTPFSLFSKLIFMARQFWYYCFSLKTSITGTSMVVQYFKTPWFQCRGPGFLPCQRTRFHVLQLRICILQLKDPAAAARKIKDRMPQPKPDTGKQINILNQQKQFLWSLDHLQRQVNVLELHKKNFYNLTT